MTTSIPPSSAGPQAVGPPDHAGDRRAWDDPTQWSGPPAVLPAGPPAPQSGDGQPLLTQDSELFVSCEPSVALQQQFEQRPVAYVALHDVGPAASKRLLSGVAAASHRPMQRLLIRRRGFGDLLATVYSVELPGVEGGTLRVYTTDVEAADAERQALMHTLLAFSRLSVVMVGGDALRNADAGLADLDRAMSRPPWPSRHLLLLPMGPALGVAAVGQDLAVRHGVQVLTAPVANRPSEAWHFIQASHAQLQSHGVLSPPRRTITEADGGPPSGNGSTRALAGSERLSESSGQDAVATQPARFLNRPDSLPPTSRAQEERRAGGLAPSRASTTSPKDLDPWDEIPQARPDAATPATSGFRATGSPRSEPSTIDPRSAPIPWSSSDPPQTSLPLPALSVLLERTSRMGGFVAGCVFNLSSGRAIAHLGDGPEAQALGRRAAALVNASTEAGRSLHLDPDFVEVWITLAKDLLIVRPVAGHRNLGLCVLLDRQVANPLLARVQLQRLDEDPAIVAGSGI